MRASLLLAIVLALCAALASSGACVGTIETSADDVNDPSAGGDSAAPYYCSYDQDCVLAAPTCCECPTFAVSRTSPVARACANVPCPASECAADVVARCTEGRCELACAPRACAPNAACPDGFATDASGCLTCECAVPEPGGCTSDSQCTRTRADCCGCQQGGFDTAVLTADRVQFDAMLMCSSSPACPGINTCTADAPTCVQGRCALVPPDPPPGACGRMDLPACPADTVCLVNVSDPADLHRVGICGPPP